MNRDRFIKIKPPKIDPAVWRPEIPLIVMERCDSPPTLSVWLAIRWLMAAFPKRQGFGTRAIAQRAKVTRKYVTGWIDQLVELGLVEIVGEEQVPNRYPLPMYAIPLRELEAASAAMALDVLADWGIHEPPPPPPQQQMALDLSDGGVALNDARERHSPALNDPRDRQHRGVKKDQVALNDSKRVALNDARDHRFPGVKKDQVESFNSRGVESFNAVGRKEGRKEGGNRAHAQDQRGDRRRPPSSGVPPHPPAGQQPLTSHPTELWRLACPQWRPIDDQQIATLASEFDAATGGYGLYWVGRAILAASLGEDLRSLKAVKAVLQRWHDTDSWGSDAPKWNKRKDQRNGQTNGPRANSGPAAGTGAGRATPWDGAGPVRITGLDATDGNE